MDSDRLSSAILALVALIEKLRGPGGCPWDAKQTDATIKTYLLEEAYEVLDAIERSVPQDLCLELGDLLFQILFLARLASERNEFDFIEVIEKITEKMIRRHPHVFGNKKVDNAGDVVIKWEEIKRAEKQYSSGIFSYLESIPVNLPALMRAHRLAERASKAGLKPERPKNKVQEDFNELESALTREERASVGEKIGDLLFDIANLSRHLDFNAEQLLRRANQRFLNRFEKMEMELAASGVELEKATPGQMNQFWEKIKDKGD